MAEIPERKKRKMGERREAGTKKQTIASRWPLIKSKKNLQITRLKDKDLFTVRILSTCSHFLFFVLLFLVYSFI